MEIDGEDEKPRNGTGRKGPTGFPPLDPDALPSANIPKYLSLDCIKRGCGTSFSYAQPIPIQPQAPC